MRLRQRDKRPVVFRPRISRKDPDATPIETWGDPVTIYGNVLPAGGKTMAEKYGERLGYMFVMYSDDQKAVQLMEEFNKEEKGFGAWVFVSPDSQKPDYRVVAVRPWQHTVIELEKVRA